VQVLLVLVLVRLVRLLLLLLRRHPQPARKMRLPSEQHRLEWVGGHLLLLSLHEPRQPRHG
jgi:hypothetical protein